jgi:hypothetical protein
VLLLYKLCGGLRDECGAGARFAAVEREGIARLRVRDGVAEVTALEFLGLGVTLRSAEGWRMERICGRGRGV